MDVKNKTKDPITGGSILSDKAETFTDLHRSHLHNKPIGMRKPPKDDRQGDLFAPATGVYDIAIKDDFKLMDFAPFGLSNKPRFDVIEYEKGDVKITISGDADTGMATVFDYDIIMYVVTFLNKETEKCKQEKAQGVSDCLPERVIKMPIYDALRFCRRHDGGRQYNEMRSILERLKKTTITVNAHVIDKEREKTHALIADYEVTGESKTGKLIEVNIDIPNWIYDHVVRPNKPFLLSMHPDYFLLTSGYERFLLRLARKAAGKDEAKWLLDTVYKNSGVTRELKKFKSEIRRIVKNRAINPLPDYDLEIEKKGKKEFLIMKRRG